MIRRTMIAILPVVALSIASPALAHEGHPHKLLGTVATAGADHLLVKGTDGKEVTVHLTKATKVLRDGQAKSVEDIKAGTRVVVTVVTHKENNQEIAVATVIELGAAPSAR